jgi:hypothetical protein
MNKKQSGEKFRIAEGVKESLSEIGKDREANITPYLIPFNLKGDTSGQIAFLCKTDKRHGATVDFNLALEVAAHDATKARAFGAGWKKVVANKTRQAPSQSTTKPHSEKFIPRPYVYHCNCGRHHLSDRMHNRILSGQHRRCSICKSRLVFIGIEE